MIRNLLAPLALGLLAACGGNPIGEDDDGGGGGGGGGSTPLLSEEVSMAVEEADLNRWQPGDATFEVRMTAQDAADLTGTYQRNAALDVDAYQAYTYQETTSNRFIVALVRKEGEMAGMIAVDAGQFSVYNGGGQVWRADAFTAPSGGLGGPFNYSGTYVGLLNVGPNAPGGPGGGLGAERAMRVNGRALITADFTEMSVSGGVDQRVVVDPEGAALNPMLNVALVTTEITATGTFEGTVRRLESQGWTDAGKYGGAFSDLGAEVATVLVFNPTNDTALFEHGLIVLQNCTAAGGPACP